MTFNEIFNAQEGLRAAEARVKETPFLTQPQVAVGKLLLAAGFEEAGVRMGTDRIATLIFTHPNVRGPVEVHGGPNEWESRLECRLGATELWWLIKATPEELFRIVERLSNLDPDEVMLRDK